MQKSLIVFCLFLGILAGANYLLYTQARQLSCTAAEYGYYAALRGDSINSVRDRINECYHNK
jgi:hypothetical protein